MEELTDEEKRAIEESLIKNYSTELFTDLGRRELKAKITALTALMNENEEYATEENLAKLDEWMSEYYPSPDEVLTDADLTAINNLLEEIGLI